MHSKVITLDNGLEVNVNRWGTEHRNSIILLHGLGSTGASFDEVATQLSKSFNVFAFDLPGHGKSTCVNTEEFFSMNSLADWVHSVVNHLNIKNFHLVGHSLGGYIGLTYASEYESSSLILLDGGYIRATVLPENTLDEELKMTEQHVQDYTFSSWEMYERNLTNNGLAKHLIDLSKHSMKNERGDIKLIIKPQTAKFIVKQKFNDPSIETLTGLSIPVLLLRCTTPKEFNDVRISETNHIKDYLDLTIIDVKDSSHDIYWDQPEIVCSQVTNWVGKNL
ncbi:alpha/beta fold hydrolase [Aquibacillus kalidii]|uniref:alpha/beta fold hydrolase n=1 Tax=Aquibacillus kalidii TaxID=2762597 RepID=UPI0016456929|nr:alpha/beta hydrolase [Aquibacillus kalidii]